MLEETKARLDELVINLHRQARTINDPIRSLEIRQAADEINDIIKRERDALFRLQLGSFSKHD